MNSDEISDPNPDAPIFCILYLKTSNISVHDDFFTNIINLEMSALVNNSCNCQLQPWRSLDQPFNEIGYGYKEKNIRDVHFEFESQWKRLVGSNFTKTSSCRNS